MIRLVYRLFYFLGVALSAIYNGFISKALYIVRNGFYTGIIKHRFKLFRGTIKGGTIRIRGGKYMEVFDNTEIYERCKIECVKIDSIGDPSLHIGKNCRIMQDCIISCFNNIRIGDDVGIAPKTFISDAVHGDFSENGLEQIDKDGIPMMFKQNIDSRPITSKGPIIIEDGVHIGFNCVIYPGVRVGHHSIINSMTIVTKNVPPYSIVSGNPGKIVVSFGEKI